jgi:hypothetical protein
VSETEPNQRADEPEPDEYLTQYQTDYPTVGEPPMSEEHRRGALDRADPVSIGAGLVLVLLGGAYLLATSGHLIVNAGWTLSLLLLGLGLSGVVGGLLGRARRGGPDRRP